MQNEIKKMIESGFSTAKTSKILNLPLGEVIATINDNGWKIIKVAFDKDQIPIILDLYKDGVSAKNLGVKYGISKLRIQKMAESVGILRDRSLCNRLYHFNENIFDAIDNEEKAYWLGFLYADAYNYEKRGWLALTLKEDDLDHLKKFSNFMGLVDNCIKIKKAYLNGKEYGTCGLKINSKYLSGKLKELGCPQAKSFSIVYPEWLSKELTFHFIRGYFDGDGCLTIRKVSKEWKWSLVGTDKMCQSISNIFKDHNLSINYRNISKTGNNTCELESSGNLKIRKICDLLYKNSSVYLDRKHQKYIDLKAQNALNHPDDFTSFQFDKIIILNNNKMNTSYIKPLSLDDRRALIAPITDSIFNTGFKFPDNSSLFISNFNKLKGKDVDITINILNNNNRICTSICKYFCNSFFNSKTTYGTSILGAFKDRNNIEKAVINKLGLDNYQEDSFNFSIQTIIDQLRSMRLCGYVSVFKPLIAKYMYMKYSNENDIVHDYSCGFGGRLLGAMSCNRQYIGTDPLTASELNKMISFFNFNNCEIIQSCSENYIGGENSIDLSWSSPPYYNLEQYSESLSQCYNKGEDYFYNKYWRQTLKNIKYMLKPNKWFGVNIDLKHHKVINIAKEYFGDIVEEVKLQSMRYHFAGEKVKNESIYMFRNIK